MTPDEFTKAGIKLYGRKHWKAKLAADIGLDSSTIYRMLTRGRIPGPVEVAVKGMLQRQRANMIMERAARRILPKGYLRPHKRKPRPAVPINQKETT